MKHKYKIATIAIIILVIVAVWFAYHKARPFIAAGYLGKADNSFKEGNFDQAISQLTTALRFDPRHALAHSLRAQTYAEKGMYDEAISDANSAIELLPMNSKIYCLMEWGRTKLTN